MTHIVVVQESHDYIACPLPRPLDQLPWQGDSLGLLFLTLTLTRLDALTAKVSGEMDKIKNDFIVVKMFYDCAECALPLDQPGLAYWTPSAYDPQLDVHDYTKRRYAPPYALCHACYVGMYEADYGVKPDFMMPEFPPADKPDWLALAAPGAEFPVRFVVVTFAN